MDNGNHFDPGFGYHVEHSIGKAACHGPSATAMNLLAEPGLIQNLAVERIDLFEEVLTQTGRLLLVPRKGFLNVGPASGRTRSPGLGPGTTNPLLDVLPGKSCFRISVVGLQTAIQFQPLSLGKRKGLRCLGDTVPKGLGQADSLGQAQ